MQNKIPDAAGFITTLDCKRLAKISFLARMREVTKSLVSKSQIDTTLDTADKNRKNKKLQTLGLSYFVGKSYFDDDESQNYSVFQLLSRLLQHLLVKIRF